MTKLALLVFSVILAGVAVLVSLDPAELEPATLDIKLDPRQIENNPMCDPIYAQQYLDIWQTMPDYNPDLGDFITKLCITPETRDDKFYALYVHLTNDTKLDALPFNYA